jgi:peptidoglycan/LPS O-acetylase OafA/YrhL
VRAFVGAVVTLPGKLSYGMYLLHPLALWLAWRLLSGVPSEAALPAFVAGVVVLAWASYTFFENPLKRRIA